MFIIDTIKCFELSHIEQLLINAYIKVAYCHNGFEFDTILCANNNISVTIKPVLSGHSKRRPKIVVILSTFIRLPFVLKIFGLPVFEWSLKTYFTVYASREGSFVFIWA